MASEFLQVFQAYIGDSVVPESIQKGNVLSLDIYKGTQAMDMTVIFPALVPFQDLQHCEKLICEKMRLKRVSIFPKYTPDLFNCTYFPELVARLKTMVSMVNGYLDDADVSYENQILHITLKHGGADIIQQAGVDKKLMQLVMEQFSFGIQVQFEGLTRIMPDVYAQTMSSLPLSSAPPRMSKREVPVADNPSTSKRARAD